MTEITVVLDKLKKEIVFYGEDAIESFTDEAEKILAEWRDEVRRETIEKYEEGSAFVVCHYSGEESVGISSQAFKITFDPYNWQQLIKDEPELFDEARKRLKELSEILFGEVGKLYFDFELKAEEEYYDKLGMEMDEQTKGD
jgi:hypothetical protein